MTDQELIEYPQKIEYSAGLIKDWLHEFIPDNSLLEVTRIEVTESGEKLAEAYHAVLIPEKEDKPANLVYTVDMDDTLVQYTKAKTDFHNQTKQIILRVCEGRYDFDPKTLDILLAQINKAARVLPQSGIHPEIYSPTLEILSLTYLITLLSHTDTTETQDLIIRLNSTSVLEDNNWIRQFIIRPAIENLLEPSNLQLEPQNGKTYFRKTKPLKCLATSINRTEIDYYQGSNELKFSDSSQRELFQRLYLHFQEIMLTSAVNLNLIPKESDKGRYVLATFGEDRFQLIKVRNFLAYLRRLGLRLPDEIIFFAEGRKEPILSHFFKHRSTKILNYRQVHIDNSQRQIDALKQAGMEAVLFDPQQDKDKKFFDLVSNPS